MTSLSNNEQNIHNHSRLTIIYLPLVELRVSIAFLKHSSISHQMLAELYTFHVLPSLR